MIDPKVFALETLVELRRSFWTIVAGLAVGLSASLVVLERADKIFEARADIFADAENLPEEFVRPTVSDEVELRLTPLRESVMNDENLANLVERVFPDARDGAARAERVAEVRNGAGFVFDPRDKVIQISYRDSDPVRAATVANELADVMIAENLEYRRGKAAELTRSVELLAQETQDRLRNKRSELAELRSRHPHELESERANNERARQDLTAKLQAKEREILDARNRVRLLRANTSSNRPKEPLPTTSSTEKARSPSRERIAALEAEIEALRSSLGDQHPEITSRRNEIAALEAAERERRDAGGSPPETAPGAPSDEPAGDGLDIWTLQVEAAELFVESLEKERAAIQADIARYDGYLRNTPEIQRRVDELAGEIAVLEKLDAEYQLRIQQAGTGQRIEEQALANPFELFRKAVPPSSPVSPQVAPILGGGAIAGIVLFVGPLIARSLMTPIVRSQAGLEEIVDLPILVRVPILDTPQAGRDRRRTTFKNLGLSILSILVFVAVYLTLRFRPF